MVVNIILRMPKGRVLNSNCNVFFKQSTKPLNILSIKDLFLIGFCSDPLASDLKKKTECGPCWIEFDNYSI